jgi:hypothetical protein
MLRDGEPARYPAPYPENGPQRRPLAELFGHLAEGRGPAGPVHPGVSPARPAASEAPPRAGTIGAASAVTGDSRPDQVRAALEALLEAMERNHRTLSSIEARLSHLARQHSMDAAVERIARVEAITARMPIGIPRSVIALVLGFATGFAAYLTY